MIQSPTCIIKTCCWCMPGSVVEHGPVMFFVGHSGGAQALTDICCRCALNRPQPPSTDKRLEAMHRLTWSLRRRRVCITQFIVVTVVSIQYHPYIRKHSIPPTYM